MAFQPGNLDTGHTIKQIPRVTRYSNNRRSVGAEGGTESVLNAENQSTAGGFPQL
jgi:hypothetical protein